MKNALLGAYCVLVACARRVPSPPSSAPASGLDRRVAHIDQELEVRRLAEGAYVVTHEPFFSSNILVVQMPDHSVVVCSSPMETQGTRALVRWIHDTLHPTRIVAINTHFHFDGTGGNDAYRQLGVATYASDLTQDLLAKRGAAMKAEVMAGFDDVEKKKRIAAMEVVPAEHTFSARDGMTLSFGGEEVRVIYPGPAHSADNVVVYFPERALLFGGCMIKGSHSIGNIGSADLNHWALAVDAIRGLGARTVVPGHRRVGGPELFDLTVSVVHEAQTQKAD